MFKTKVKATKGNSRETRIVIISDTHITPTGYQFNRKAFDIGMRSISKIKDVDLYLHLGDLTHFGVLQDYEYFSDLFKDLDFISEDTPLMCLIGNHDALNVGYLLFEEYLGERFIKYETDHLYLIGLDSTKPDLATGIIHHEIIDKTEKELKSADQKDKLKIICFHHQLIPIPYTGRERSAIDDSGNMLKMIIDTNTDLVLNGHRHISNLYSANTQEKNFFIFNAGTFSCNKTRYREQFTYTILDIENNCLKFRVLPIFESVKPKKIHSKLNYFSLPHIKPSQKSYCKLIQLSNTLISQSSDKNIINQVINKINHLSNVELIIHCGNLTKTGIEEEYINASEILDELNYPYLVVPGYSDMPPPAWKSWEKYIGSQHPEFENEKIYFQGLNSTTVDSPNGFIGRKRLEQTIDDILERHYEKITGVAFFHPCIPTPLSVWRTDLSDSGDALSRFSSSKVDLILNNSPSINFNVKIENSVFSNGGSLERNHFDLSFIEIDFYREGIITLLEHNLTQNLSRLIGKYKSEFFTE
jgi:3',5'-cyclic-AMP phosphodiesterase